MSTNKTVFGDKIFIVAELSANHTQRNNIAIETIRAAKRAGADAIKLQTYTAETITLIEYAAKTMKPIVISTGIATHEDIQLAVFTCWRENGFVLS